MKYRLMYKDRPGGWAEWSRHRTLKGALKEAALVEEVYHGWFRLQLWTVAKVEKAVVRIGKNN